MRSALSLTLVLLAAMSGQAARACDYAAGQHPLRLLMCAASQGEHGSALNFSIDTDHVAASASRQQPHDPHPVAVFFTPEPASRSFEAELVASLPSRGP